MTYRSLSWIFTLFTAILVSCSTAPVSNPSTLFIPMNSAIILRINQSSEWSQFADSTKIPAAQAIPIQKLQSIKNGIWTGALCNSGAGKMDWIWTTTLQDSSSIKRLEEDVTLTLDSNYFALYHENAFAISSSKILIQNALNQSNSGFNIVNNKAFNKLWVNANSSDALNLFFQHEELSAVGSWYMDEDWSWMENLAVWSEVDIDFGQGRVLMTSVSINPDSAQVFLSTFNESSSNMEVSDVIAASASHAVKMNVGNTAEWIRSFNVYRGKEQRLKQALSVLGPLNMDPMTASTWFEGSFVHIGYGKEKVIAAKLNEEQELGDVLKKASGQSKLFQGHLVGTLEKQNKFLFSALFGWWYKNLENPSWMIYKDWLLVSTSQETLEVYSNELAAKATWSSVKSLEALAKGIDKKGHFALALKATSESAHRYLNLPIQEHSNEYVIHGNLAVKNALTFGNARMYEVEKSAVETSTYLWSTALESTIKSGPWLVKNHRTGKNDIFVQDDQHVLYWVSSDGTIQWKKSLNESIVGEVHQVDLFKNQKYQLLFTTGMQLYCIDILGRDVENYPIKLLENTSIGLSVLDYDKNRNYRFLIPAGTKLYNYSSEGKLIQGWKTDAASGAQLIQKPFLFQKNGKDFIVTSTSQKPLILNRRGEIRINTEIGTASMNPWTIKNGDIPFLERIGGEGEIQHQNWSGTSTATAHDLGELKGVCFENYGKVVWNNNAVEVRNEEGTQHFTADGIEHVRCYPGGTGLILTKETVQAVNLKNGDYYGSFTGTNAAAGRLSQTGMPVVILRQGNSIICYEL
ncbi:MAG: hypothetical protein CMP53_08385 [Flavobacteriales bacterium]|nr:hypothetical protein [Flavobacteriales bacterium]